MEETGEVQERPRDSFAQGSQLKAGLSSESKRPFI